MLSCTNCKENISERYAHSIEKNCCPLCGENIVSPKLQHLLVNLKLIFDDAGEEFLPAIESWLLTNYKLKKTSSPSNINDGGETNYVPKRQNPGRGVGVNRAGSENDIEISTSRTAKENEQPTQPSNDFMKRAGIKPQNKSFKSIVDDIKNRTGAAPPEAFVGLAEEELREQSEYMDADIGGSQEFYTVEDNSSGNNSAFDLFADSPENGIKQTLELERAKKLQQSMFSNGGKFRRGE